MGANVKTNSHFVLSALVLLMLCGSVLRANPIGIGWGLINSSAPVRYGHRADADTVRNVVVLFGGKDSLEQMPNDIWEMSCEWPYAWNHIEATGPEGRIGHGLCYFAADSSTLLFGGQNQVGEFLNDTWLWDGQSWTKVDSTGPAPRAYFAFTYDPNGHRAVLFGGIGDDSLYGDTWQWDGQHWQQLDVSGPSPRIMAGMGYYRELSGGHCILFGGQAGYHGNVFDDTWGWNGAIWYPITIEGEAPLGRVGHAMGMGSHYQQVCVFGGKDSCAAATSLDDAWTFSKYGDAYHWDENFHVPDQPSSRTEAALVNSNGYDFIVIGGRDSLRIFPEVWAYPVFLVSYVVGDINGSGNFNGLDVSYAVSFFKGGPPPMDFVPCLPGEPWWYVSGDVNGSCNFNGLDVTYMVTYLKGGPTLIPCPQCPPSR